MGKTNCRANTYYLILIKKSRLNFGCACVYLHGECSQRCCIRNLLGMVGCLGVMGFFFLVANLFLFFDINCLHNFKKNGRKMSARKAHL